MNDQFSHSRDWNSFKFDAPKSQKKLNTFRLLNRLCWSGNLIAAIFLIQDLFGGVAGTMNLNFVVLFALGAMFGFGSFKCEQKIKFIKYQLSHFSKPEE